MDNLPEVLTRLNNRLDTLEHRVALLEHPSEPLEALPEPASVAISAVEATEPNSFADAGATFAVIGKAMLGMAGAYLLRAVAESGSFPKLAVVALAIAYAAMWLVWAARVPARAWFAGTTYAATSALILAPMLWELTLRFHFLAPASAAAVLAAFVLGAYALAWSRDLTPIVWVAALTSALTAIPLLIATHDMLPFLCVVLLTAAVTEIASGRSRWRSVRPIVALAADIGALALLYLYMSPETSRADYASLSSGALLAPSLVLLLIYGTSAALRAVLLRQRITIFEAVQSAIAFLLVTETILHFGSASSPSLFGCFCLALSAAAYTTVFLCFDGPGNDRNYAVCATWGLALFLAGSYLCLPPIWLVTILVSAAVFASLIGAIRSCLTLQFHGLIILSVATAVSGLLDYAGHALAMAFPSPPVPIAWAVAAAAILCYALSGPSHPGPWKPRLIQALSAVLAVAAAATLLVSALVWLTAHAITLGESHVAVIRTLAGCIVALALAWFGPRWQRAELLWITYGLLALVAAKLLFEDLRQGHPKFIAASIFVYAVMLILVPQLARRDPKPSRPAQIDNPQP